MATEPCPVCAHGFPKLPTRAKLTIGERVHCENCMARVRLGPRILLFWLPTVALVVFVFVRFMLQEPIVIDWNARVTAAAIVACGFAGHWVLPLLVNRLDPLSRRAVARYRKQSETGS